MNGDCPAILAAKKALIALDTPVSAGVLTALQF
jgi:hypothetical protein